MENKMNLEAATLLLKLQTKIETEENLPIAWAAILANDALNHFEPAVREGVELWLKDELTDDFTVENIRIGTLRRAMGLSPFCALHAMNMMIAESENSHTLRWFRARK